MLDNLEGCLVANGNGQQGGHEGEQDGEDEWFGQPALHQADAEFNHVRSSLSSG